MAEQSEQSQVDSKQKEQKQRGVLSLSEEEFKILQQECSIFGIVLDEQGYIITRAEHVHNNKRYFFVMNIGKICNSFRMFIGDRFSSHLFICDTIPDVMRILHFYARNTFGSGGSFQQLEDLYEAKIPEEFKEIEAKFDFFKDPRRKIKPDICLYDIDYVKLGFPEGKEIAKNVKDLLRQYKIAKEECKKLEVLKIERLRFELKDPVRISEVTIIDPKAFEFSASELESVGKGDIRDVNLDKLEETLKEKRQSRNDLLTMIFDMDTKLENLWDAYIEKEIAPSLKQGLDHLRESLAGIIARYDLEDLLKGIINMLQQ